MNHIKIPLGLADDGFYCLSYMFVIKSFYLVSGSLIKIQLVSVVLNLYITFAYPEV